MFAFAWKCGILGPHARGWKVNQWHGMAARANETLTSLVPGYKYSCIPWLVVCLKRCVYLVGNVVFWALMPVVGTSTSGTGWLRARMKP